MSDEQRITMVIRQTVEHRVSDHIDLDEVRAWSAARTPAGAPQPPLTAWRVLEYLESQPGWKHHLPTLLIDSTEQEPMDEELVAIQIHYPEGAP